MKHENKIVIRYATG